MEKLTPDKKADQLIDHVDNYPWVDETKRDNILKKLQPQDQPPTQITPNQRDPLHN